MVRRLLTAAVLAALSVGPVLAQTPPATQPPSAPPPAAAGRADLPDAVKEVLSAVVKISTRVPPRARSAATLGAEREGHGVVIGEDGLILTIGYLIMEADEVVVTWGDARRVPATVVAYDHESGFGLVRTAIPLKLPVVRLADSDPLASKDEAFVAGFGGAAAAQRVLVTSRRDFAGYWEYLLENAIFTTPPYPLFGGAALLSREGALLGIGSLFVQDALAKGNSTVPGNMFLPVNRLKPIMADLLEKGRSAGKPRPWLGVLIAESLGRIAIANVSDGGPAATAGLRRGDVVATIAGQPVVDAADFYRKLWELGEAGVDVVLQVERYTVIREITVKSGDRYKYLRLDSSL